MASDVPLANPILVCGLGHVGYRAVKLLIRLGRRGVVIAQQVNEDWRRAIEPQFCVLVGDAQDDRLLEQAGVARAHAVIVATDDHLANLSIALDVRRMNPSAVLVVRQFDQDLAIHLEQLVKIDRALSASALAVPQFVAAALGTTVNCSFATGDTAWCVGEHAVEAGTPEPRTIGACFGGDSETVIALRRGDEVIVPCPAQTPVQAGDRVISLRLEEEGGSCGQACRGARPPAGLSRFRSFRLACRQSWREVPGVMRSALAALILVVMVSVLVFHWALNLPLVDALYFVMTTVTTVGYGDIHLGAAPPLLKLYGIFVMLCGTAIFAVIFSIATDLLLRLRLRDLMSHGVAHWHDHIIVAGLGKIGFRLVRDLVELGQPVVAIEQRADAPFLDAARDLVPVVLGNAKTPEVLVKAGAASAKAVVAATDDDLTNLSTVLAARRLQPSCRTVLRVFNSELAEKMQQGLAVDAVLSMSAAAVPTFVAAALCPQVLQAFLLGDCLLAVFRQVVGAAAKPCCRSETEADQVLLFVRPAGATRYERIGGPTAQEGDEVLGVRWYRLAPKRDAR